MRRWNRLLLLAVLISGAPLLLAAPVLDPIAPAGSIHDDPDPAGKAIASFRQHTGWSGEVIAHTTIGADGNAITIARPVLLPSPFGTCDDIDDCGEQIKKACLEEGMAGVKTVTVRLEKGDSCSGQCAGLELVYVEVSCLKPVEPQPKPTPIRP